MDLSWVVRSIVREARQLLRVWTVVRTCGEESRGRGIACSNKEHVIWFEDVHGYYDGREVTKKDCRATFDLDKSNVRETCQHGWWTCVAGGTQVRVRNAIGIGKSPPPQWGTVTSYSSKILVTNVGHKMRRSSNVKCASKKS